MSFRDSFLSYRYSLCQPWTRSDWRAYLVNRAARILPVYYLGWILTAPALLMAVWHTAGWWRTAAVGVFHLTLLQACIRVSL